MLVYPIRLERDDDGTLLATSPDLPEMTTFGIDEEDALRRAADALEEAIAARMSRRQEVPLPSLGPPSVALSTRTEAKVLLYREMRTRGMAKAELARRLRWHRPQIDRLLDLRHHSRLDQFDAAFRALGRQLSMATGASRRERTPRP